MPKAETILILEDNNERIAAFQKVGAALGDGFELKIWRNAHSMIAECEQYFPSTALISLDHDLNPQPGVTTDPGSGLDVANHLGNFKEAVAQIIRVGGDCDTNAAIVGGIVALSAGRQSIPPDWLNAREKIRIL